MRLFVAAVAALVVALIAMPVGAQLSGPKIAVHVQPHSTGKGVSFCAESPADTSNMVPCSQFVTAADVSTTLLVGMDIYIIVAQADSNGVSGATFGIQYNPASGAGVDLVGGWFLCSSGLEFPSASWPNSGEGNVLTWNTTTACGLTSIDPDGIHATAGGLYVYAYDPDQFVVTPHMKLSSGASLRTANCLGAETVLDAKAAGFISFGVGTGCNPCVSPTGCTTPVEETTWGKIKNTY